MSVPTYGRCRLNPFNRTLWNWNRYAEYKIGRDQLLLIEPYGIEIRIFGRITIRINKLLIEPYGIEIEIIHWIYPPQKAFNRTLWNWNQKEAILDTLLINAFNRTLWNWNRIQETKDSTLSLPFNRTLWNWNIFESALHFLRFVHLLIEPYGIEIDKKTTLILFATTTFNRTLWNWNITHIVFRFGFFCSFNRTLWNWNLIWSRQIVIILSSF